MPGGAQRIMFAAPCRFPLTVFAPITMSLIHKGRIMISHLPVFAMAARRALWAGVVGICVLVVCLAVWPVNARAVVSNNVPLDHWSYNAIDKLAGFGLIYSDMRGTRPYTRLEVARLVNEALREKEQRKDLKIPPLLDYFLERFQSEFAEELAVYGRGNGGSGAKLVFNPIEEAQARYVFVDGKPRDFLNLSTGYRQYPGATGSGIVATEGTPMLPNNEGVVYGRGSNFSFQFASSFRLWDVFSGYVEPIFLVRETDSSGRSLAALSNNRVQGSIDAYDQAEADILKVYGKFSALNIELEAGRDSMWLGQGYRGTLIVSNNAAPFDMLKLSNPNPSILPWIFKYLGLFKYTAFIARLDDDRDFPNPAFFGGRLEFKPHPLVEFGVTGSLIFGGSGSNSIGMPGASGQEDGIMSVDARVRLPFLRNAEIYAEYGGEDLLTDTPYWFEPVFNDIAYLVGIYFPSILEDGKTDLRIEYSNTAFKKGPGHGGLWYGHSKYRSGDTYEQMIIGHAMGPDARDLFVRTTHFLWNNFSLGFDYEHMDRGITNGQTVERTDGIGFDGTYDLNDHWRVMLRYGFESISEFNLVPGDNQQNHLLMTTVKYTF